MYGLTGSIATGKSTVAAMLRELGAVVLDADQIAREVVAVGEPGWKQVAEAFPDVIGEDGTIDRRKLGRLVFADAQQRRKLEAIIHPLVFERIKTQGQLLEQDNQIVFADIPLLYETNSHTWLDWVVVVYVPQEVQLRRLIQRDKLSEAEAWSRIQAQMSIEEKRKLADYVIDNSGSLAETKVQVDRLWHQIIE
ncbi:MAG: dephospho-CoA kinase [Firmicutes bacterium]|nr:dephospho-CoA kinase [Bacillota bacterium]